MSPILHAVIDLAPACGSAQERYAAIRSVWIDALDAESIGWCPVALRYEEGSMLHQVRSRKIVVILFVAIGAACAACVVSCGSSAKVDARSTTIGQELKDLEDARNKGLLTEEEYNRAREAIVKRK
jgi:hypothetical protein